MACYCCSSFSFLSPLCNVFVSTLVLWKIDSDTIVRKVVVSMGIILVCIFFIVIAGGAVVVVAAIIALVKREHMK